jgi:hypothetical protein
MFHNTRFSPWNLPSITDVTSNSTSKSLCTVAGAVMTNYWQNTVSQKSKVEPTIRVALVCHSTITQLPSKHKKHLQPTAQFHVNYMNISKFWTPKFSSYHRSHWPTICVIYLKWILKKTATEQKHSKGSMFPAIHYSHKYNKINLQKLNSKCGEMIS